MNLYWVKDKTQKIYLTDDLWLGSSMNYTNQIMYVPNIQFTLPIDVLRGDNSNECIPDSTFEFLIEFDSGHIFHGKVVQKSYDAIAGTVMVDGVHIADELTHYRIPANYAVHNKTFDDLYNPKEPEQAGDAGQSTATSESTSTSESNSSSDSESETVEKKVSNDKILEASKAIAEDLRGKFNHDGWTFLCMEDIEDVTFTYLFSNQDKLTALTDACRQTEDVFWRVSMTEMRTIEIGKFGQYKELMITEDNMLGTTFDVVEDFRDITNYGIYFTDKSDSGTTALTLRDVYNRPELQDEAFPIIMTGQEINTERNYQYIELLPFGANNAGDYAVLDVEGIALEEGNIFEAAFTSNDVQSVAEKNEEVTDADRLEASKQLYKQAIRKLRHSRRKIGYTVKVANLPVNYNVGDKARLTMISQILEMTTCTNYYKKMLEVDDYFFISQITENIESGGLVTYDLTLEKFIYNNSEV